MQFSTKAEYGLRAMVSLARHYQEGYYSLAKISRQQGISLAYLERLMAKLKKAGLIKSARGSKGGYLLTRLPARISVRKIMETLEGELAPFKCETLSCVKKGCGAKKVWRRIEFQVLRTLNKMTLKDLI